jgi:predicted SAM-dependent methyltransferase
MLSTIKRRLEEVRGILDRPEATEVRARQLVQEGIIGIQYGSASNFFGAGWVNVDLNFSNEELKNSNCLKFDLTGRHPFPDACFRFGYAEDFLEHLDQDQSLRFLIEARRTLKPGGVLRLSFPGLEGVLKKHYQPPNFDGAALASREAYSMWGHKHFYSRGELEITAIALGFKAVRFESHGHTQYAELRGVDSRPDQAQLNTYVELTA